jgi:hypothetical protein
MIDRRKSEPSTDGALINSGHKFDRRKNSKAEVKVPKASFPQPQYNSTDPQGGEGGVGNDALRSGSSAHCSTTENRSFEVLVEAF